MDRILIIIPAFNAEFSLADIIRQIGLHLNTSAVEYNTVVIDDGSTDNTSQVAAGLGAIVSRHPKNLGKGEALKTGFQYAISKQYPVIVTMDADLQHDPASLSSMLDFYTKGDYDIVIGARTFDRRKMSLSRILSNRITSRLISFRARQPIKDSQSGYRIIRTEAIKDLTLKTSRFETESEILIRLAKKGGKFGFFPIETIYAGEKSNISHFQDSWRFIKMYLNTLFN